MTGNPVATDSVNRSSSSGGLSKKNRNIVIGCVVGIGVPLIIAVLVVLYFYCVQSKKTDFIDSDGKVVTAYRANSFKKWWYGLIGKDISDQYESNSPLGTSNSPILSEDDNHSYSTNNENLQETTNSGGAHSNELMLEEEKYYDEYGNELNARNY